jgi:hypothetical protein
MFETEEYYGGTYESPLEHEEEREEDFDMGDYIDYCYENYRDSLLESEEE